MARRAPTSARIDHTMRSARTACAVVLTVVMTGCASGGELDPPTPDRSGPVYPTVGAGDAAPPSAGEKPGGDDHGHDRTPAAPPPPAQAAPIAAAFAAAWARPDLPPDEWWRGVAPMCDEGFARALRTVDPARVPATRVTGRPFVKQAPTGGVAVYEVPTDPGTLTVTLAGVDGRWVVTGNDFTRSVTQ